MIPTLRSWLRSKSFQTEKPIQNPLYLPYPPSPRVETEKKYYILKMVDISSSMMLAEKGRLGTQGTPLL